MMYRDYPAAIARVELEIEGIAAALVIAEASDASRALLHAHDRAVRQLVALRHEFKAAAQDRGTPCAWQRRIMATPETHHAITI